MRVVVLGATGLIGAHVTDTLLAAGHQVTAVTRSASQRSDTESLRWVAADVESLTEAQTAGLLEGHDGVVMAMGADDRSLAPAPAYDFFYRANVLTTARLATAAAQVGASRFVVCGSFFTYFNRLWPELELAVHHPYVRARVAQAEVALSTGSAMTSVVLELPYIFGRAPGRVPIWRPLVKYVNSPAPLFYTSGGTTAVAVSQVARAIQGALERPVASGCWPVGTHDLTWPQMLNRLRADGRTRRVHTVPRGPVQPMLWGLAQYTRLRGHEHGLDPRFLLDFQCREAFFTADDRQASMAALGYEARDLDTAFRDTIAASMNSIRIGGTQVRT